jgi:hypothetical protein
MLGGVQQDKATDISVSLMLGSSQSQSTTRNTGDTTRSSTVAAGQDISVQATGVEGEAGSGDLLVRGSRIVAQGDVVLSAQDALTLQAAQDRYSERSQNKSSSAAVGVKIGSEGMGFSASGSVGRGRGDGDDVVQVNTQVQAGQTVGMSSGGDTALQGAVVQGQQVQAHVGGDLTVQSLQDTSTYSSRQQNVGGSVTIGPSPGGQASYSSSKVNSDYASVVQRSGIEAGDGGFQVNVQGQTTLQGGVIASTDKAVDEGRNSLNTQGLSLSDIDNRASYEAKAVSVSVGTGAGQNSAGIGQASDSAASTTTAGVSGLAGDQSVRTGDASQGLDRIFDRERVTQDVTAQATVMAEFGKQASKAVGDYAGFKERSLTKQANDEPDPDKRQALLDEAQQWKEGGSYRVALHAVVGGLTGDLGGALGAGASAAAAPYIDDLQAQLQSSLQKAGLSDTVAKGVASLAAGGTAAVLGGAVGGSAGAVAGFNQDTNNRQLHPSEKQRIQELARKKAQDTCRGDASCLQHATLYWSDMLERVAEGQVDTQEAIKNQAMYEQIIAAAGHKGSQASMGMAESFFEHLGEARRLLAADAGKPILDGRGRVVLGTDGQPQTYFSATQAQRDNPYGNIFPGGSPSSQASVMPGKERREQSLLEGMNARSGQATPDTTLEELLIGIRVPARGAGSVVKVTERSPGGALPGTAQAAEEALLRSGGAFDKAGNPLLDMSKLTNEQKRVISEQLFAPNTVRQILPDGQQIARVQGHGHTGIDELYKVNRPDVDYVSVEIKFVGQDHKTGAQVLKNTDDGKQGSTSWIGGSGRIEKAVGGEAEVRSIRHALDAGRIESWVVTVRPDGSTFVEVLDAMGKAKPVDTSRIIQPNLNLTGARK